MNEPMQLEEGEKLKLVAAMLWLRGEITQTALKNVLNDEEIKDLRFGKEWVADVIPEIRR